MTEKINSGRCFDIVGVLYVLMMLTNGLVLLPEGLSQLVWYSFLLLGWVAVIKRGKLKADIVSRLFYLYCLASVFSLFFSKYFTPALILSTAQFVLVTLLCVNIRWFQIRKWLETYLKYQTIIVVIACIYSLILKTFGSLMQYGNYRINYIFHPLISQRTDGAINDLGYCAFWNNPNVFGFYLLISFIYVLTNRTWKRKTKTAILMICLVGSTLANSRAIYVCIVLVLVLYVYFKMAYSQRMLSVVLLGITAIIILALGVLSQFIASIDMTGRNEMWSQMLTVISGNPLLGVGFSVTTKYILGTEDDTVGSHNSFLNILAENGVVGFVIFLVIVLLVLWMIKMLREKFAITFMTTDSGMLVFASILFVVYLAYSMIENTVMIVSGRHVLWMAILIYIKYVYAETTWAYDSDNKIR